MKKCMVLFTIIALVCSLCACNSTAPAGKSDDNRTLNSGTPQIAGENTGSESGELRFLCDTYSDSACHTENGYYYLTGDMVELQDGNYGTHLMYMDFATCREIYLCNTSGCKHDSPDCPAVFLYDDFPVYSTKLFVHNGYLYILSRESDDDSTISFDSLDMEKTESQPAILYRANLDGTKRQKIYTFDPSLTLEDMIIGDGQGIYVITKKTSIEQEGNTSYTTSSERKLMFLDLESLNVTEVCPMTFEDNIFWHVMGIHNDSLVLNGTDFGRELSREEEKDSDTYIDLYTKSSDVYTLLDLKSAKLKEIYRTANQDIHSAQLIGDTLYLSSSKNQNIESLNIDTGELKTLCSSPQNQILGSIGDMLYCRVWDLADDQTCSFVDTRTGEVSHSSLVNQYNGWALEFRAETESDVLLVYDYDAKKNSDDSYEIYQYKYALIQKEDLFAGRENYRKIEMIGPGQ